MAEDKLQLQRFELKYLINEGTARAIQDFVRAYLEIDEFGESMPGFSYPVHSLYLDSDDLKLYQSTINGTKNRFKLRLRYYDEGPESPVFFEVKRRMNNCILKQRGGVRREAVPWLLAGHLPEPGNMISDGAAKLVALQRFSALMSEMHATPKVHIAYEREAWISRSDNSVRVTMDRSVRCEPECGPRLSTRLGDPIAVFGVGVVLELKFTNNFPNWFRELTRAFNLVQTGASKYVDGIWLMGEYRLKNPLARFEWLDAAHPINGQQRRVIPSENMISFMEREER
ncbi:MAG: polyphosphate polymerase domain-containing protein [Candidatus Omnitrophica bacterium]|nr:polyphosphate polymerase domain-containing protein [Candidatus Omnitrophota bacterium]